jgi:hypothetical protein
MLSVALSAPPPHAYLGEVSQERLEGALLALKNLEATEQSIRAYYDRLMQMTLSSGFSVQPLVDDYNALLTHYVNIAKPLVDAVNAEARKQGDPEQPLDFPRKLAVVSGKITPATFALAPSIATQAELVAALKKVTAADLVPISSLRIETWRALEQEVTTGLGQAWVGPLIKTAIVVLGVWIVAKYVAEPLIDRIGESIGGVTGSAQLKTAAQNKVALVDRMSRMYALCAKTAKTADEQKACMASAAKAVTVTAEAGVKPTWSFGQWLVFFGALAAVGVGGYYGIRYVRRRTAKRREEVEVLPRGLLPAGA